MSDTSLVFNFLRGRDTASPHMKQIAGNATTMAAGIRLSAIISVAATATLVASIAALAAQSVALIYAAAPMINLIATIPAFAYAAAFSLLPLVVGFMGLGAALKTTAHTGASGVSQLVAAERRLTQAQLAATDAQKGLNDARATAVQKLRDIAVQLARANLDQQEATLGVRDAEMALRAARLSGDRSQVQHAEFALQDARLSQIEVTNRLADTQVEYDKRQKQGVEGSDEVTQALRRQADAQQALGDAQKSMASGGGANPAAAAYAKLSKAGQQLVDVLKSLLPRWQSFHKAIQQSLLAGVAASVASLAAVWLPMLTAKLSGVAKGWNEALRGAAHFLTLPATVRDFNIILDNTVAMGHRLAASFTVWWDGFNQFAVVGSQWLPRFGDWVLRVGQRFDAWATAARNTGKAQAWIKEGIQVTSQFWEITKHLSSAIAGIFRAGQGGPNWLPGLVDGTKALSDWVNSPAGQGKLAAMFATLRDVGSQLFKVLQVVIPALLDLFGNQAAMKSLSDTTAVFGTVIGFLADHLGLLAQWMPIIIGAFIVYKTLQSASLAVEVVRLPILAAQVVTSIAMIAALRAHSAALIQNTAVTQAAAVAQTELDVAMDANPIGLIILGIVALIVVIILLIKYHKEILHFFVWVWGYIWRFLKMIGAWFAGPFVDFFRNAFHWITNHVLAFAKKQHDIMFGVIDFFASLPGRIRSAVAGLWDSLFDSFKATLNRIIDLWNNFHLTLGGGSVLGVDIPSVTLDTPDLPHLARGAIIPATPGGRLIVAGEGGQDEAVVPLPSGGLGTGEVHVHFHATNSQGSYLLGEVRKLIREGKLRVVVVNGKPQLAI